MMYPIGCGIGDVYPSLSCIVPEDPHSLTPAAWKGNTQMNGTATELHKYCGTFQGA